MQQLHPKAIWLFFFKYLPTYVFFGFFLCFFTFPVLGLIFLPIAFIGGGDGPNVIGVVIAFFLGAITYLVVISGLAYLWAKLSYKYYKYELSELGFKKESGVIWKRYVTIPYDRIQNVDIYRGLLARLLGLSDLHIQTAGMSMPMQYGAMQSEGRLPGLSPEIAEKLRDELIMRARQNKIQGQGL